MSEANSTAGSPISLSRSDLAWVLVPAVVMSLGWGLRGYIGGGPFGAMIPEAGQAIERIGQFVRARLA